VKIGQLIDCGIEESGVRIQNSEVRMKRHPAKNFQDLIVWQKAHTFVLFMYRYTTLLPKEELCGFISQARRAAVSIPANIAEGFKKNLIFSLLVII